MTKDNPRSKGRGSVYKRESDGLWVGSISIGSGQHRRRPTVTVNPRHPKILTDKQAEAAVIVALNKLKQDEEERGGLPNPKQTVEQWLRVWFESIAGKKIRPKTAATYRTMLEQYIIPELGHIQLTALTAAHVRKLETSITTRLKNPKKPELGYLSSTTAAQAHRVLSVALKYAVREKRVRSNVAEDTDAPRRAVRKIGILSTHDGARMIRDTFEERLGSRWAAALLTGARQGELLGLEIDRVSDVLDLSWQLQRLSWEHGCKSPCGAARGAECPDRKITKPADWEHRYLTGGMWLSRPKSNAGYRIIPLPDQVRAVLERRIFAASTEPNPFGLLWTSDPKMVPGHQKTRPLDGSPIDPATDNYRWHALLKRLEIGDVRLHDARHTTASLLGELGVSEAVIMKILGHSSAVVTRGYQNIDRRQMSEAMALVSARLGLSPSVGDEGSITEHP